MRPVVLADCTPDMALLREDAFAPVLCLVGVSDERQALRYNDECPFALAATVFGPEPQARAFAPLINAGVVVVNDVIVPHADPRLPFGGRRRSGFGVTRGAEGLLEMTRPKAVAVRRGRFRPHFDPPHADDEQLFLGYLTAAHAGRGWERVRAAARVVRLLVGRGRAGKSPAAENETREKAS